MVGIKFTTVFLVGDHSLTGPKNDHPTPPQESPKVKTKCLNIGSLRLYDPEYHLPRAQRIRWRNTDKKIAAIKPPLPTQLGGAERPRARRAVTK